MKPRRISLRAVTWAAGQYPPRGDDKLILFALACHADDSTMLAYPSVAGLSAFSSLERKRVLSSLSRLNAGGWIEDAGRVGKTLQIKNWRLVLTREESGIGTVTNNDNSPNSGPLDYPETVP